MKALTAFIALLLLAGTISVQAKHKHKAKRVLVFSKTKGFRHDCIPAAKIAIMQLGKENGFAPLSACFFDQAKFRKNVVLLHSHFMGFAVQHDEKPLHHHHRSINNYSEINCSHRKQIG